MELHRDRFERFHVEDLRRADTSHEAGASTAWGDGLAAIADATKALSDWVIDSGINESDFKVMGDTTSRYFTIQFSGQVGTAAKRVQKVLDNMRGKGGTWTRLLAPAVVQEFPIFTVSTNAGRCPHFATVWIRWRIHDS